MLRGRGVGGKEGQNRPDLRVKALVAIRGHVNLHEPPKDFLKIFGKIRYHDRYDVSVSPIKPRV